MNRASRILVPLMAILLLTWIVLSWPAIQDDALIHLRYANNIRLGHHISYDGIHPDFGTSSLLYVGLLALLSSFIQSPALPRSLSSLVHLGLFAGMAFFFAKKAPRQSSLVRLLSLIVLFLLSVPSSVRWLDDGMETGIVMCFVGLLCVLTFRESTRNQITPRSYLGFLILGTVMVLLRTELLLLCGISSLILTLNSVASARRPKTFKTYLKTSLQSSHLVVGGLIAVAGIVWKMHVLLPDTALAKSHGPSIWRGVLTASLTVTLGAFTFGAGMMLLWIATFVLLLRARRITLSTLGANSLFPVTVALACLRGQEIQGIRYLVWTMFFSILWNIFELDMVQPAGTSTKRESGHILAYALIALVILVQPFEARAMYHVLRGRAKIMDIMEGQHLDVLADRLGVAADVGTIGYFSKADICDLNGLVNGRAAAAMSPAQRAAACVARNPGFLFVNVPQLTDFSHYLTISQWDVCGDYDFTNVRSEDLHYLIVPATDAAPLCKAATGSVPYPAARLLASQAKPLLPTPKKEQALTVAH
jgi:hypothetical protein